MKYKDLVKVIKNHRGPILVNVLVPNDVAYMKVSRTAVLDFLEARPEIYEYFDPHTIDNILYLDRANED